jgi:hypothetical protein
MKYNLVLLGTLLLGSLLWSCEKKADLPQSSAPVSSRALDTATRADSVVLAPQAETLPAPRPVFSGQNLNEHLFVGQIYPSGKVYLRHFVQDSIPRGPWPRELVVYAILPGKKLMPIQYARYLDTVPSEVVDYTVRTIYIPGWEGMDPDHEPCGMGKINPQRGDVKLLGEDFFNTVFDHCESNEGVAIYQSQPSKLSYRVIAMEKSYALTPLQIQANQLRPMTAGEQKTVAQDKKQSEAQIASEECATVPQWIDSAHVLFEAKLRDSLQIRLSSYLNPGCGAHLSALYVLDLMKSGRLLRTFEINQYQGAI